MGEARPALAGRPADARRGRGLLARGRGGTLGGLRSFGPGPGAAAFLLAFATGYAAQFVPVPFVATGGVDAATTFALAAVGVPLEVALLGVAANRVFSFWLPVWPALALVAALPATGRALERARQRAVVAASPAVPPEHD